MKFRHWQLICTIADVAFCLPEGQGVDPLHQMVFSALENIVKGPLEGKDIVLYVDNTLPFFGVSSFLISLTLETKGYHILAIDVAERDYSLDEIKNSHAVHIAMLSSDPSFFFRNMFKRWSPDTLLLVCFSENATWTRTIFSHRTLESVRNLALLTPLHFNNSEREKLGVFTAYPFSIKKDERVFLDVWTPDAFRDFHQLFPDRFTSFEGHRFHLSTDEEDAPWFFSQEVDGMLQFKGVVLDMMNAFSKRFNFSYEVTNKASDWNWGAFVNGSWNGVLGDIDRGLKDFTINPFLMTYNRSRDFQSSYVFWVEGFGIAVLSPRPLPRWINVYLPFTPLVWFLLVVTYIVVTNIMAIQDRLQRAPFLNGFSNTWSYLLRAALNQSAPRLPTAFWQRLFLGFWFIACYLVVAFYSSNLIAFLTVPVYPKRISTLRQLADSEFRVAMEDYGNFLPGALREATDDVYRKIGEKLDLFVELDDVIARVADGSHVYIETYQYNYISLATNYKDKLQTYMLNEHAYPGPLCWYFPRNLPWIHKFDSALMREVETGLLNHWIKATYRILQIRQPSKEKKIEAEDEMPLSLENLAGAFFIIVPLWAISLIIFAGEIYFYKRRYHRRKRLVIISKA